MANEKRLIDANALKRWTCEWCNKTRPEEPCEPSDCAVMLFYDGQPTVDAVEVVRCKDCKNRCDEGSCPMYYVEEIEWDDDGYTEVDFVPHDLTHDEGFCDRGERRNNETEKPV